MMGMGLREERGKIKEERLKIRVGWVQKKNLRTADLIRCRRCIHYNTPLYFSLSGVYSLVKLPDLLPTFTV